MAGTATAPLDPNTVSLRRTGSEAGATPRRFVPDPALRYAHPANDGIVKALRALAQSGPAPSGDPSPACSSDTLALLARDLARSCLSDLYGQPVLAARGIIFGVAPGAAWLFVRLPPAETDEALALGACPECSLGDDWYGLDPCPADPPPAIASALARLGACAHEYALAIPDLPFG